MIVALLAAACAEPAPPSLAAGSLESALPAAIWPADPSVVSAVACPGLDTDLVAQTTVCTAVLGADSITVDVDVDELGAADAVIREELFVVADAADGLAARLRADLGVDPLEVSCADAVVLAEPGRSLSCEASSGERSISFTLVLGHRAGDWTLEPVDF